MASRPKVADKLLWIDLEMTGLDPFKDKIMEVAAIITDWDFNVIDTYESAIKVSPITMRRRMKANSDFWNAFPDVKNQLIEQNITASRLVDVEDDILSFISADFPESELIILSGNSIHADRKFIAEYMPRLEKRLHYRMLDVSAWKVVFEGKYKQAFMKAEAHRAIDDIKGSIEELKYYIKRVK